MLQAGRSTSMAYRDMLEYMCESLSAGQPENNQLIEYSKKIAESVKNLIGCAEVSSPPWLLYYTIIEYRVKSFWFPRLFYNIVFVQTENKQLIEYSKQIAESTGNPIGCAEVSSPPWWL